MNSTDLRQYIRDRARKVMNDVKDHASAGRTASRTYCDGMLEGLTEVMAWIGDSDGLRMVQAERESA